ncbi:SDR family NAD(P)-dependent oxidoreductase [Aquisediminimonas sediminicola]|uniref:SDR family NAD(P)-dependent oxidoreductase n=1 Tax=Alteraquisediminimonas sediminicola TaxID=2676787 RepID=UPI001C8D9EDF|nr:SDR family oxidoreductase [Aquisediminimonas sediminicola]
MRLFEDQIVLVTGAASGLGLETALAFAREGAEVVVSDISQVGIERAAAHIQAQGGRATACAADVSAASEVDALFKLISEKFGRLDVAVNGAGIGGTPSSILEANEAEFDRVISVNLKGVWLCMRGEIPLMLRQGRGVIINIASALGLTALPNSGAYAAAKHGVVGLTKVAALETADKSIRINAICPGVIDTPMNKFILDDAELLAQMERLHPVGRLGRPEEIATAILWLSDPRSTFITGAAIPVDGGWTARG